MVENISATNPPRIIYSKAKKYILVIPATIEIRSNTSSDVILERRRNAEDHYSCDLLTKKYVSDASNRVRRKTCLSSTCSSPVNNGLDSAPSLTSGQHVDKVLNLLLPDIFYSRSLSP